MSTPDRSLCRLPLPCCQGALTEAEDAARGARAREDAARAQGCEFAERARRAETLGEEAEAELSQVGGMQGQAWHGATSP